MNASKVLLYNMLNHQGCCNQPTQFIGCRCLVGKPIARGSCFLFSGASFPLNLDLEELICDNIALRLGTVGYRENVFLHVPDRVTTDRA